MSSTIGGKQFVLLRFQICKNITRNETWDWTPFKDILMTNFNRNLAVVALTVLGAIYLPGKSNMQVMQHIVQKRNRGQRSKTQRAAFERSQKTLRKYAVIFWLDQLPVSNY